jgi:hypothetical protein
MNATTRAAIAAALDTVDGLRGYLRQPSTLRPGTAWPQWGGGTRDEESPGFLETWRVTVVCDQGTPDAADAFLDAHGDDLLDALAPVLFVDSYAPARLDTEAGPLYALVITGRSE